MLGPMGISSHLFYFFPDIVFSGPEALYSGATGRRTWRYEYDNRTFLVQSGMREELKGVVRFFFLSSLFIIGLFVG